jgi:hypothetical protein
MRSINGTWKQLLDQGLLHGTNEVSPITITKKPLNVLEGIHPQR